MIQLDIEIRNKDYEPWKQIKQIEAKQKAQNKTNM